MREHLTHAIYYMEVHLIFCSIVWFAAWALTSLPGGSATTKHWIWFATALNFIVPLGAMVDGLAAHHISWATPLGLVGRLGASISASPPIAVSLVSLWLVGVITMLARLWARVARESRSARAVFSDSNLGSGQPFHGVAVRFGDGGRGPAAVGILRSHISLPIGIDRLLSERELNSVLIHELRHAKRHDNLIRLFYELSLCVLWFHPLVWITGSRLALYRELSCDESVIQRGHGGELVSALAKLANSEDALLLEATASSLLGHRLTQLTAARPCRMSMAANSMLSACFGVVLSAGVFATVTHTACCFILAGSE